MSLHGALQPLQGCKTPGFHLQLNDLLTADLGAASSGFVGQAVHNLLCPMWTLSQSLIWIITLFRYYNCTLKSLDKRVNMSHLSELQCVSSRSTHGWLSLHRAASASQEWERTGTALWRSAGHACCFPTETNCHLLHTRQERHYSSSSRGSNRKSRAIIEWRWSTNYRTGERPEWYTNMKWKTTGWFIMKVNTLWERSVQTALHICF